MTDKTTERKPQVTVVLDHEMKKKFDTQARSKGLTTAAWLRMLGLQDIARNEF